MADWTNLPNQAVGVGGLPSGTTVTALRDNPVAIAQGAAGAPRIEDAALDTTVTNAGREWVAARIAGAAAGAVGTYAFAWRNSTATAPAFGGTVAGSQLRPAGFTSSSGVLVSNFLTTFPSSTDILGSDGARSATFNGTWRCMGEATRSSGNLGNYPHTLWLRIS